MLLGLADGYVGYVESAEHWHRAEGESQRSWYGPTLAEVLTIEPSLLPSPVPQLKSIEPKLLEKAQ